MHRINGTTYVTLPSTPAALPRSRAPAWQARNPDGTLTRAQVAVRLYRSAREGRSEVDAWRYALQA